MTMSL